MRSAILLALVLGVMSKRHEDKKVFVTDFFFHVRKGHKADSGSGTDYLEQVEISTTETAYTKSFTLLLFLPSTGLFPGLSGLLKHAEHTVHVLDPGGLCDSLFALFGQAFVSDPLPFLTYQFDQILRPVLVLDP